MKVLQGDREFLERWLGTDMIPQDIQDEYWKRIRLFHTSGATGPLGALAMVDLFRSLGYELKEEKPAPLVEWRTSLGCQVETVYGDQTLMGQLVDIANDGALVCRLETIPGLTEIPAYRVKLLDNVKPVAEAPKPEKKPRPEQKKRGPKPRNPQENKADMDKTFWTTDDDWNAIKDTARKRGIEVPFKKKPDLVSELNAKIQEDLVEAVKEAQFSDG